MSELSHYIPRRLDDPAKLLFWDADVGMIGMIIIMLGVTFGYPLSGILAGVGACVFLSKLKAGVHAGMTAHLLYWVTGIPEPKSLPPSYLRELNG